MELRLVYNLRGEHPRKMGDYPPDIDADWDTPETISLLRSSLIQIGFDVVDICCSRNIVKELIKSQSLIFNICEMAQGAYREALIPSLCELQKIPYVFSEPDVMVKTLDKNICNLLVVQANADVPNWFLIKNVRDLELLEDLNRYPYIVKPNSEGSGIGISDQSVVYNQKDLYSRIGYVTSAYRQSVLVQEYIDGLELTVGVLGSANRIEVLAPILINLPSSKVYGCEQKENSETQALYSVCSNEIINKKVEVSARNIYQALGCRDAARIDFRFDQVNEKLYFLEINPLPHLHPVIGDFCRSAYGAGYLYNDLLKKICDYAIVRVVN